MFYTEPFGINIIGGGIRVTYLSTTITNYLICKDIIKQSEKEIYQYGVLTLIVNLIGILEILILGWITNALYLSVIFIISFMILRSFTGGFHCKHYIPCNVTYGCLYLLCTYVHLQIVSGFILELVCVLSVLVICYMSPVIHVNKPLDEKKKKRNRVIAISISVILFLLSFIGIQFGIIKYVLISTALLQLITIRRNDYVK